MDDNNKILNEQDSPLKFIKRNVNPKRILALLNRGATSLSKEGFEATFRKIDFRVRLMLKLDAYKHRLDIPLKKDLAFQRKASFVFMPKISIVVPLYNTKEKFLVQLLESVINQSYQNYELVLVDASDKIDLTKIINKYKNEKIIYKKLSENNGISENTNAGFSLCTGDYISLLDHDDTLSLNALYENVKAINETGADMLYSDEVVLDENFKKLVSYHFKIKYAPDSLRSNNYITHFLVFKKELFDEVGPFLQKEYDGAQDYDLILRLSEKAKCIHHIPKVLYYWRAHINSTALDMKSKMYAFVAGQKAIQAHLKRLDLKGEVLINKEYPGSYTVKYAIDSKPLVSIIIPNKDHVEDLSKCIKSIFEFGSWDNLEIVIVENNSTTDEIFTYYEELIKTYDNIKIAKYKGEFNFSKICNFGVSNSKGEYILLLNNDIEFIKADAIPSLLQFCQRSDVATVGAKLLYPDNTIQHAGVIVGINSSAGHSHKGLDATSPGDMYRLVTAQNYLGVTGACLMTKRSLYEKNPLNEDIFAVAYNDVDYCLNLYKQGYLSVYTPECLAYHHEGKSRGLDKVLTQSQTKSQERYLREKAAFYDKWSEFFDYNDPYYNPHFTLLYDNYGYK